VTDRVRLLQHKTEAYWFYRVLSLVYDRWVNPLFWTPQMRAAALVAAELDARSLRVLDVGAGTGFTTAGSSSTSTRSASRCSTRARISWHAPGQSRRWPPARS
jgi:hypothetical protein